MNGYEILGRGVWWAGRWYLRRSYGHLVPSRKLATAILALIGVVAAGLAGRRAFSSS